MRLVSVVLGVSSVAAECPSQSAKVWFHISAQERFDDVWPRIHREIKSTIQGLQAKVSNVDFGASISGDRLSGYDDQCFAPLVDFGGPLAEKLTLLEQKLNRTSFLNASPDFSDSLSALPYIGNTQFGPSNPDEYRRIVIISDTNGKHNNATTPKNKEYCQGSKEIDWNVEETAKCGDKQCSYKYLTHDQILAPLRERQIGLIAWVGDRSLSQDAVDAKSAIDDYNWLCSANKEKYFEHTDCHVENLLPNKDAVGPNGNISIEKSEDLGMEYAGVLNHLVEPIGACPAVSTFAKKRQENVLEFENWNSCIPCRQNARMKEPEAMQCFDRASPVCNVSMGVFQNLKNLCHRRLAEGAHIAFQLGGYTDHHGHVWKLDSFSYRNIAGGPTFHKAIRLEKFRDISDLDMRTCTFSRGDVDLVSFTEKSSGTRHITLSELSDSTPGAYYVLTLAEGAWGYPDLSGSYGDQVDTFEGLPFIKECEDDEPKNVAADDQTADEHKSI